MERFTIVPQKDAELWEYYKKHVASFWTSEEIDLSDDANDWEKLTENEKHFIKTILAFFAAADGIVNENIATNFYSEVQIPEARAFYSFQIAMETIHAETYSILIEFFVKDKSEQDRLFTAINNLKPVKEKAMFSLKYLDNSVDFSTRLVAFACVEGILFSGSFCAIFWFKKRGLMKGLTFSNELISRDEGLHCDFACTIYKKYNNILSDAAVHSIIDEAVNVEISFICYALPCLLVGMNATLMEQYIKFVADRLLCSLGHPKLYNVTNPFDWMELISLQGKTNFFERRVGEYQKCGVMNDTPSLFSLQEDF